MMTRKDYRLIAEAIKDANLDFQPWQQLMDELVPALHTINPHFNSAKFIEATLPNPEPGTSRHSLHTAGGAL